MKGDDNMLDCRKVRNAAIMTLALGTAFGLGVITCVYSELKLLAVFMNETKHGSSGTKGS